jgi:hypothetical protein
MYIDPERIREKVVMVSFKTASNVPGVTEVNYKKTSGHLVAWLRMKHSTPLTEVVMVT